MRQVFYTLLMLLALLPAVHGQQVPTIVPPSPEAASTFKFTEVPVSLYTGVPNINIPIYTIEARGLTIPISISYHARGIKVDEIASRVGLGWTLNCGGMVSRQIRGIKDETGQYGYLGVDSNSETFFTTASMRQQLWAGNYNNQYDLIPDQYFFDANGISGKFILNRFENGKPLVQHSSDIKIIKGEGTWTIIDSKGNRYLFTKTESEQTMKSYVSSEMTGNYSVTGSYASDPNSWLITKITTALGESIDFVYEDTPEETSFYRRSHDTKQLFPDPNGGPPQALSNYYETHFSEIRGYNWRLKRINYDKGWVTFGYQDREDLLGSGRLKTVSVFNSKGIRVKGYNLEYEYTTWSPFYDTDVNYYLDGFDTVARKRLFLKSIGEVASSGTQTKGAYRFEYDTITLPTRHSNKQDFWGYYNGRSNGPFLKAMVPEIGGRSVDTTYAGAGMLKKIIYPEGGSTSFTYEHNKLLNVQFPTDVIPKDINPMKPGKVDLGHFDPNDNGKYSIPFTVGAGIIGNISSEVKLYNNDEGCGTSAIDHSNQCRFAITIEKAGVPGTFLTLYKGLRDISLPPGEYYLKVKASVSPTEDPNYPLSSIYFTVKLRWGERVALNEELLYSSGKRIRKIEYKDADGNRGLSKTYSYTDPSTGKSTGRLFGLPNFFGVRKRGFALNGLPIIIFERYACMPGGPLSTYQGNSLGYGMVTEYYGEGTNTIGKTEHKFTMTPDGGGAYYTFPYHPPADNEWLRGQEILTTHYRKNGNAFKKVREIDTRYIYGGLEISNESSPGTDPLDVVSTPAVFTPFVPVTLQGYVKPLTEDFNHPNVFYDKTRTAFRMPLTILATYTSLTQQWMDTIPSLEFPDPIQTDVPGYKTYHLNGGSMDLLSTSSTDFFEDGSEFMTRTNYKYNYEKHYNVSQALEDLHNGKLKITKYFYPSDTQMVGKPNVSKLIANNILNIPLVTQTYENGQKLSEQETQYRDWDTSAERDLLAPYIIHTSKGVADTEPRLWYNAVDPDNGNPLEVRQEQGTSISYIWGYNKTLPVAKIENFSYTAIPAGLITAIQQTSDKPITLFYTEEDNKVEMLSKLQDLRNAPALSGTMITTYTYKPEVGVTTMTDPKGDKFTYEYDGFNRLKLVRDKDNNILSENQYHYRPQN